MRGEDAMENIEHLLWMASVGIIPLSFVSWIVIIALFFKLLAFVCKEMQSISESVLIITKNLTDAYEYVINKVRSIKRQKK